MILLLLYTGMRRGELCGLEWKDIDFTERRLSIVRTSQYIGHGQIITKEPKTRSGRQSYPLYPAERLQGMAEYTETSYRRTLGEYRQAVYPKQRRTHLSRYGNRMVR